MLVLVVLLTNISQTRGITDEEKITIEKGLEAGKAVAEALKDGDFRKSLEMLGKKLTPFLSALGPLASIAVAFVPGSDSAQLQYMKQEFEKVNNKLDVVISEFKNVRDAIEWSAVGVSYGVYERKIKAAEENLNEVYNAHPAYVHERETAFLKAYHNDFDNSLDKLYRAIMSHDHTFSKNILEAAARSTKNHKRKFEKFSLGLVQLLLRGIRVRISAFAMDYSKHTVEEEKNKWITRMNNLRQKLQSRSNEIKLHYFTQMSADVDDLIIRHHGLTNIGLLGVIYDFLADKYDYRMWFVAVYNDVVQVDKHAVKFCSGYHKFHKYGKNIVVVSQDKYYQHSFKHADAVKVIDAVENDINSCSEATRAPNGRALALVSDVEKRTGIGCSPYVLRMAVVEGIHLWFRNYYGYTHRAYRKILKTKSCCWGGFWNRRCRRTYWKHYLILFG